MKLEQDPTTAVYNHDHMYPNTPDGWYPTTATLSNVKQLCIRKVGDWCSGLCVRHDDGSVEVLGRWDPSDGNAIVNIYDSSRDGPLTTLHFRYSKDNIYKSQIIDIATGIATGILPEDEGIVFQWEAFYDQPHIAWFFTETRDNYVTYWDGQRTPFRPRWTTSWTKILNI